VTRYGCGKIAYSTEEEARLGVVAGRTVITVYDCPDCPAWHTSSHPTHLPKRTKRRKGKRRKGKRR
jgi:hypothetical protein